MGTRKPPLRLASIVALLLLPQLGTAAQWQPPRAVRLRGGKEWRSLPRAFLTGASKQVGERPAALLLRPGDLAFSKDCVLPYLAADGTALNVNTSAGIITLGKAVVALSLSKEQKGWEWLEKASRQELAALRFVQFGKGVAPERIPALWRPAAASPRLGLSFEKKDGARDVLAVFEPRWLVAPVETIGENADLVLPRLRRLELLALNVEKTATGLGFIRAMPKLHTLMLLAWDPEKTGPLRLGNPSPASLWLSGKMKDLDPLQGGRDLTELYLVLCGELSDISGLERFPKLDTLVLTGCEKVKDLAPLTRLHSLRWLGLPPGVSQGQLARVVEQNPDLKVLQLIACEKLKDLSALRGLREPFAIIAVGDYDLPPLASLKSLRYLGLEAELFEKNPEKVRKLQKALPNCVLAPCEGVCLGSGWILAIAIAAALAWAVRGRSRSGGESQGIRAGQS